MNEKQGDLLDKRIRQSLSGLPDAPPPGSSFDAARLWEQLRPDLTAKPVVTKKRAAGWWLAAASVVGLLLAMWWFGLPTTKPVATTQTATVRPSYERTKTTDGEPKLSELPTPRQHTEQLSTVAVERLTNERKPAGQPVQSSVLSDAVVAVQPEPISTASSISAPQPASALPESVSLSPVSVAPKLAETPTLKHRFRVVHENELPAEDEAHRVRYATETYTERFVRIGTGNRTIPALNQNLPGLVLPLNRNLTQ